MFKKILVPLDGSRLAESALQPTLALARQLGSTLLLVHAPVPESALAPTAEGIGILNEEYMLARARSSGETYLRRVLSEHAQTDVPVAIELVEGDPAGAIIDTAQAHQADLIVMTTHGYSGLTRWMLGSVTEKVLRAAPCPVLILRMSKMPERVLIPLDGSALAETALAAATTLAQAFSAPLTLFRVVAELGVHDMEDFDSSEPGLGRRLQEDLAQGARDYLDDHAAPLRKAGLTIHAVVQNGQAAAQILEFAEHDHADVIVMATHGRTGLQRWVYGSVTAKVLRGAHCALLVVRPEVPPSDKADLL